MDELNDDLSLRKALQVIDEWDVDFAALFGLDDPPAKKRRRRPSAKEEQARLKQEIDELQETLEPAADTPSNDRDALSQEWEAIATRQCEQRLALEVENEKLRKVLASQLNCARRAASLVDKVNTIGAALGSEPIVSLDKYNGPRIPVPEHLERLDALALEAWRLFASDRFDRDDCRSVEFLNQKSGRSVEVQVSWVLPFSIERIVDALWVLTTRMQRPERTTCFKDIYATQDTLVSLSVSESKTLGTIRGEQMQAMGGATHGQIATRIEPLTSDGSVLLVSDMDVKNLQENGQCRSRVNGNGFLLVQPLNASCETPLCRVKWCRRMIGSPPDDSAAATAEYAKWVHGFTSQKMREKWWRSIDINLQTIENMLLQQEQPRSR